MKLGARIFKTALAIVFALFVAESLHLPTPIFAGIAAIFAIQPSIYRSYLRIIEQTQGNLIGAFIAITFVLLFGQQLVVVGLASVFIILVMIKLKLEKSISMALVMMIAIVEIKSESFLNYALLRFVTITIGVFAAFLINLIFMPPKYETKLFQTIHQAQDEIIRWTRLVGRQASEHGSTKMALKKLQGRLKQVEELYMLFKEERSYCKKNTRVKARKLVIYRQMISTSKSSYELLKKLHQFESELISLPEHFRMMIQERLDTLLTYHEQLHLKFVGKLKSDNTVFTPNADYLQRHEVMDIFVKEINITKEEEEFSAYHLLHILSALLNYEEQLEHSDKLINLFQTYHSNEMNKKMEADFY
ncbi:aromatic acid exporter family protein [Filibacter tadaridae]|uniref:p-hydroxybenzoic acid efflux pump subunit AaeB n=1 Tax=Filibacter tadaridae TaxID=2483811 RepID=A0A3P5WGK8_9BACL|nr:aromatic acid exporter family protein [Filibacter tadaridae]VDC22713.1 p-hydroxybenzoic acid efflux pump subunit AaeB [Filibacter tadaridae]